MITDTSSYLDINAEVLAGLKKNDPVKYHTVKRYLECQDIFRQNLAESDDVMIAKAEATTHWNTWANARLDEYKNLEKQGKVIGGMPLSNDPDAEKWKAESKCDFSFLSFCSQQNPGRTNITTADNDTPVRDILVHQIDFEGYKFPYDTIFTGCTFYMRTYFSSARFRKGAIFRKSHFLYDTNFSGSIFYETNNFENAVFGEKDNHIDINFAYCNFRHTAIFENTHFFGIVSFDNSVFSNSVQFRSAIFYGIKVSFKNTEVHGNSCFEGAIFPHVVFEQTSFNGSAHFYHARFRSGAYFQGVRFSGCTEFGGVRFECIADFRNIHCSDYTRFQQSRFKGKANFHLARFDEPVIFDLVTFEKKVDFTAISSHRSFSLSESRFYFVPNFNEAVFHAPPVLDDVTIESQLTAQYGDFYCVPKPRENAIDIARNFRAMGKLAHEARDWLNEMEFIAQETRARRFGVDFPFGPNPGRFWFGLLFEKFSCFGRSLLRPFLLWWILFLTLASLYHILSIHGTYGDALALSWQQGLVVSGLIRSDHYRMLLEKMFGNDISNSLFFLMSLHTLGAAICIFLFFLALRNHFRIR